MVKAAGRREIKRDRTRRAFVDAACRIIEEEGIEAATVRRTADEAGFTLATLYKYVSCMDELLWQVRSEFIERTAEHFAGGVPRRIDDWAGLREELRRFLTYFLERPRIFRFLYGVTLDPAARPDPAAGNQEALAAAMAPAAEFLGRRCSGEAAAREALGTAAFALMGMLCVALGGNDAMDGEATDRSLDQLCATLRRAAGEKE